LIVGLLLAFSQTQVKTIGSLFVVSLDGVGHFFYHTAEQTKPAHRPNAGPRVDTVGDWKKE